MTKRLHRVFLPFAASLVLMCAAWLSAAQTELPARFSEAQLYFELNNTDEDLGLHGSIDGDTWTELAINGPGGRLLSLFTQNALTSHGMTQLFFESAEPTFDDLRPAAFFRRFPEGRYRITGRLKGGAGIASSVMLSHVMPAPVDNVTVNGVPAAASCDAPLPTVSAPVMIDWDPVTESHPTVGKQGTIRIGQYQFFVEREGVKLGVDLPPTVTEFDIPQAITAMGDEFKFEIIARTATGNNTAIESCFRVL
jgi:hypothetical protein